MTASPYDFCRHGACPKKEEGGRRKEGRKEGRARKGSAAVCHIPTRLAFDGGCFFCWIANFFTSGLPMPPAGWTTGDVSMRQHRTLWDGTFWVAHTDWTYGLPDLSMHVGGKKRSPDDCFDAPHRFAYRADRRMTLLQCCCLPLSPT